MNTQTHYLNATKGWKSWFFTLDHKRIGIMYLICIIAAFFLGGLCALAFRFELLTPDSLFLTAKEYNQLFTLHGAIMVFLFIIPSIPASLGNFVLPLQLGAKDVAFPRLNLLSWYLYVFGALFCIFSLVSGAVDTGWTFYTPYSTQTGTSVISMTLGAFILGFSSILTGVNFMATVHQMRAPGMTWFKMPLFIWGIYATAIIQVLATPVLAITLLLLVFERMFGVGIFDPSIGGDPVLFQHFFWFYSHPAVYIMILPGMAIMSELVTTFCKRNIFGYNFIAYSSLSIAVISFVVWGHHLFLSGQSDFVSMLFSLITFFVGIPTGIKIFNWLMTMYQGSIDFKTPFLYFLSFIFLFTIGGLTGIYLATLSVDIHLHDTYFVVAHFHYVMMGGTVIAFLGGIHYWWPKMFGVMYPQLAAKISAIFIFLGFNITFFSQFILGAKGMPRRYYHYLEEFQPFHIASTVGTWFLALGFIIMFIYLIYSLKRGPKVGNSPWGGITLEWQTSSPPPVENFIKDPVIQYGPYDYKNVVIND